MLLWLRNLNKFSKLVFVGVRKALILECYGLLTAFWGKNKTKGEKMTEVSKKISVDFSRKSVTRPTFAVQNDKGARKLAVKLYDDGVPYMVEAGATAVLNYKRPDGVCCALTAKVYESEVSINLNADVLGAVGLTECTVSVFDANGNKLTSSEFCIDVTEELYAGEPISEMPEYSLLEGVFMKLAEFETAEIQRNEAEAKRDEAEIQREENEAERDKKLYANLGVGGSAVLKKDGWTEEKTQSIEVLGLGENDLIVFYPLSEADRGVLGIYGVFISPDVEGGRVTARAKVKPIADISLRYFITRGRSAEEEV
jgi:hypothetical protein